MKYFLSTMEVTTTPGKQIIAISEKDPHFKGIRFNRNFGKSAALQTGFRAVTGKVVITMDADLQDSPDEIPDLYKMVTTDGYHLVSGWKKKRHDPISKTIPSKFFNYITSRLSGIKLHDFQLWIESLSIFRRKEHHGVW